MSDPTTTGVINDIFQNNLDVIVGNFAAVSGASSRLLLGLATLEFLLFLWGAYQARSEEVIKKAIEKLFLIFVVALLTFNWGTVAGFMRGYIGGGGAGVGGGNSMITSMNPAYIASDGLDKVSVIFSPEGQKALMEGSFFNDPESAKRKKERDAQKKKAQKDQGWFAETTGFDGESMVQGFMDAGSEIATAIVVGLIFCMLAILIVLVHFYVALQLFVLTIDWYLTVAMTNLLIPFAVNKHTSSLASAGFQAVVRKSVQLGVMMAILGMFGNTIQGLGLGPQPTMVDILSLLLGSLTMAFMVKNIPQIASSIFSGGGGTIDVGGAMSAAAASVAGRAMNAMTAGAGTAVGAAGSVAGAAGGLAAKGAGKAGKHMGGKVLEGGKAAVQGGIAVGSKGVEMAKQGASMIGRGDEGKGARDSAPKSMSELHAMKMQESNTTTNTLEQTEQGAMKVDERGNLDSRETSSSPSSSPSSEQGGMKTPSGASHPAETSDTPSSHPASAQGEAMRGERANPSMTTSGADAHVAPGAQGGDGSTPSQGGTPSSPSRGGGDWDSVPDTSPDATPPKDPKE